jgi:hypothetical protein
LRIREHLAAHWSAWFDGLTLTVEADGATTLEGSVADAAALYGLIARLRDRGLTLLGVECLEVGSTVRGRQAVDAATDL